MNTWLESISHMLPAFFNWRDAVEIIFFSSVFYYLSVWLKKDKQKNLLPYFYGYCMLGFTAYHLQLATISSLMLLFTPVLIVFFALIHQDTLQKNFIALRSITAAQHTNANWLEQLIRTCLVATNNNKAVLCAIERQESLAGMLNTPCLLNADCEQAILEMLIASESFDETHMIWLNAHGKLRGVNASWNKTIDPTWITESVQELAPWKQAALFFTSKTDALMFQITPNSNAFTLVVKGKLYEHIDTENTLKFIANYLRSNEPDHIEGAVKYENSHKKRTHQQHQS